MPIARSAAATLLLALLLPAAATGLQPQTDSRLHDPLPLDVALSLRGHNGRSPVNLSPDGEWIAHTVETEETVPRTGSRAYSETGFPFAEGNARMQATLSHVETDEVVVLGEPDSASWAPTWSPDGRRVAFYSDAGGEAGLWIWERDSGRARRVSDAIVRPFFGFEAPRWSPDGERLLVKLLPEGTTLAEANALFPAGRQEAAEPKPEPGEPTVEVRRSEAMEAAETPEADGESTGETEPEPGQEPDRTPLPDEAPGDDPPEQLTLPDTTETFRADLAIVTPSADRGDRLERIVEGELVRLYAFAPDGDRVVYSVLAGAEPASQQARFDLRVHELETGDAMLLADDIRLRYGIEWSLSPDGRQLAYMESGQMADGDLVLIAMADGDTRVLDNDAPDLQRSDGERPPIWSADSETLYGIGAGALWAIDPEDGAAREVARIDGWSMADLITTSYASPVAFSTDGGRTVWVATDETEGTRSGIHAIELPDEVGATGSTGDTSGTDDASGTRDAGESSRGRSAAASDRSAEATVRPVLQEDKSYGGLFSLAASHATGQIVFVSVDQQHLGELQVLDLDTGETWQASRINEELNRYALGEARIIRWRSAHGDPLAGTLLLPPDHEPGQRLPLVVWLYGGAHGSRAVNRFGLWGSAAALNMHVLATRGFAVLYPDAPVRTGRITDDLEAAVLPGVNAAIDGGWADPERLAVMGQSYGSINTLALLTRTDRFDAAIITAAVLHPDLFADYLTGTGYYEQGQGNMGGTIWEYPERYRENSPLFDFPRIETPVLIGQGALDGNLVPAEAIFTALDRLDKPVEYRLYRGEGHVITGRANVHDFWDRRLEFLAQHLDLEMRPNGSVAPR